jgi:hypothetical protein
LQNWDALAYYYRKSRFEYLLLKDKKQAEYYAEKAKESDKKLRFQTLANLAFCKIINEKLDDAEEELNSIDQRFGKRDLDIRRGLRIRLAIARNRYEDALFLSNEIHDKSSKSYKGIRLDALRGYLDNCSLSDNERTELELELKKLAIELKNISEIELVPEIDSYFDDLE